MDTRLIADLTRASLSALCFLVWDICITFDDEVEYIWSKPRNSWLKWAFLFARYFSLFTQICNATVQFSIITDDTFAQNHKSALRIWFGLQVVLVFLIMTGAEIVMMARVYALYNKNRWIGIGFILLLLTECTIVATGIGLTFPRKETFVPKDVVKHTSKSFAFFGLATVASQVIILVLSVVRYVRGHWNRARIMQLMLRDGTIAFCVLFVVTGTLLLYVFQDFPYAATDLSWMISFISVVECRLILNLQHHHTVESEWTTSRTTSHELTTVFTAHDRYFEESRLRQGAELSPT